MRIQIKTYKTARSKVSHAEFSLLVLQLHDVVAHVLHFSALI